MEYDTDIRSYLDILNFYANSPAPQGGIEVEVIEVEADQPCVSDKLNDLAERLRSLRDTTGGDYSMGFEQGLEMAAQMVENIAKNIGGAHGTKV